MPTPHGSRGGMAFSADELRVLRRALAENLHPARPSPAEGRERSGDASTGPRGRSEDVQDMLRLAEAIDEAVREGGRLRAFLLAELVRYRSALPGSAAGYLERLEDALAGGYLPDAADLAALRRLAVLPCGLQERQRRAALRVRCHTLAEAEVRKRLAEPAAPVPRPTRTRSLELLIGGAAVSPVPASTGGANPMNAKQHANEPVEKAPADEAPESPQKPAKKAAAKKPARPHIPTPAELFPRGVRRTG